MKRAKKVDKQSRDDVEINYWESKESKQACSLFHRWHIQQFYGFLSCSFKRAKRKFFACDSKAHDSNTKLR